MKGQIVNIFGFVGHMPLSQRPVSATALSSMEMNELGRVPIKLYLQEQAMGWTWPLTRSLLTPALQHRFPENNAFRETKRGKFRGSHYKPPATALPVFQGAAWAQLTASPGGAGVLGRDREGTQRTAGTREIATKLVLSLSFLY